MQNTPSLPIINFIMGVTFAQQNHDFCREMMKTVLRESAAGGADIVPLVNDLARALSFLAGAIDPTRLE